MANIMTKRGNQDNVITYEHICDTTADMANIEPQYKTLGSVCIVIKGESGGLEVYIAGSNREWVSITEVAGGSSGIALPTVTAQDEGKVLTVNSSGAWAAANASGGGGSLVVPVFTLTPGKDEGVYDCTCDMTYEEVLSAVDGGRCCMAKALYEDDEDNVYHCHLTWTGKDSDDNYYIEFSAVYVDEEYVGEKMFTLWADGSCEYETTQYPTNPISPDPI